MTNSTEPSGAVESWPRISLVTAVFNGARFLEATIRSVLNQRYPNLEYIIIDDGSTDSTPEIIREFQAQLSFTAQQPNRGLYAALNAGFAHSTGEIMGWLNSSDMLHVNGLFTVGSIFRELRDVEWITGRPIAFTDIGVPAFVADLNRWSRYRFLAGASKYIQQESTFWRRTLWERAGGKLSIEHRAEGDFELWIRFFRHAKLHSVNALIGGYRMHDNALSMGNVEQYNQKCDEIAAAELNNVRGSRFLKLFRWTNQAVKPIPKIGGLWYRIAIRSLYRLPGPDLAPLIQYDAANRRWALDE